MREFQQRHSFHLEAGKRRQHPPDGAATRRDLTASIRRNGAVYSPRVRHDEDAQMRSLTLPLTLATSLLIGTSAFAASPTMSGSSTANDAMSTSATSHKMATKHATVAKTHVASGKIRSIDAKANTLTLTNGKKFLLPADFTKSSVKTGEHVRISYMMAGKHMSATAVKAVD
ncbi:DUF1344 domain-containing protein [Jiella mangrovi]|uniref:DUF1344 domain-containing protein n=1 Tax=Jiella mangrovi TaxID=2821407 RepID=A0ABS4BHE0_9HYPH|nr:DUF1344 domain-containing protein [Jiella mangrovi]MBP0615982.1 DUF1344 domain-containing protein [Jiella mangrovi]